MTTPAPVFDHNLCLLCYGDDKDLENFREYFKLCNKGHKLGVLGFVEDGKKFLDSRSRKRLRSLLDYSIRKHGKYDLEDWRIDRLNQIIHNQVKGLLE